MKTKMNEQRRRLMLAGLATVPLMQMLRGKLHLKPALLTAAV
jgi:hypothetical protein